jgi:hypothetical protein
MRRSTSRLLISLVLALTIPVQAIAGVAAGMCTVLGHDDHGAAAPHHHTVANDHDGAGHHDGDDASDKTAGNAHCPPCAACCATTAIPSSALSLLAHRPAASEIAVRLPSFSGIQPDRLERPPLAL